MDHTTIEEINQMFTNVQALLEMQNGRRISLYFKCSLKESGHGTDEVTLATMMTRINFVRNAMPAAEMEQVAAEIKAD